MIMEILDNALDAGIAECDFWEMSIAEINRKINSYNRIYTRQMKDKAVMDYTLANLIGLSIGRMFSSENEMPKIEEAYPSLFDEDIEELEEQRQAQANELMVARFMEFANAHNRKFNEQGGETLNGRNVES